MADFINVWVEYSDQFEYKTFGEIAKCVSGRIIDKDSCAFTGKYPIVGGGIKPTRFCDSFNNVENTITISLVGSNAGFVSWQDTKFWASPSCAVVNKDCFKEIDYRFLFFALKQCESELAKRRHGAAIPCINLQDINGLSIPIPSFGIQRKIVERLDK